MCSFLAVTISLALLQSSLAALIHGTTNISKGNTINCSDFAAPPVAPPLPVHTATNPFTKTFPQRPVPTGNFGPRSSIGAFRATRGVSHPCINPGPSPPLAKVIQALVKLILALAKSTKASVKVTQALAKSTQDSTKEVPTWANLFQTSGKISINSVGVAPTMAKLHLTPPQAQVVLMVRQDLTPVPMAIEESRNLV
ncbi:hypothetical protein H4Q26_007842 [Puccinia striiformis f. sp. tritici PST-130]|nr:hypothetical protein H4Q26_007842 [Puccinia striiformis f. sp. tritici PST-130]